MPKLSTAREYLSRLEQRIAQQSDPQRKAWLSTYRDHWWGEVINDVEMVMATMSQGPIRYTFDGHPFMTPDSNMGSINDLAGTRAMYGSFPRAVTFIRRRPMIDTETPASPMNCAAACRRGGQSAGAAGPEIWVFAFLQ